MSILANPTVTLVEDETAFAEELIEYLEPYGFRVDLLESLDDVSVRLLRDIKPDLLVLDQFVHRRDAVPLISHLRTFFAGGVVVLTGNPDPTDQIMALESGADDFVAKSRGPRELLARLRAVLRRSATKLATSNVPAVATQPCARPWRIDTRRVELRAPDGSVLPLTRTEFHALLALARKPGEVISRDDLSIGTLGRPFSPLDRCVDNMVSRIRKVLEPHTAGSPAISAVRGKGYVFEAFNLSDAIVTDPAGMICQA